MYGGEVGKPKKEYKAYYTKVNNLYILNSHYNKMIHIVGSALLPVNIKQSKKTNVDVWTSFIKKTTIDIDIENDCD